MGNIKCCLWVYLVLLGVLVNAVEQQSLETPRDELDLVIEDEITEKLSRDLLQSIEKKFQIDLEKSVDMVLAKIKMLLQNGTTHIQDKMIELQNTIDAMRSDDKDKMDLCLLDRQNETTALAEKALHQMVVCGYALIGHDPAQAVTRVLGLKKMIKEGVQPLYGEKKEIYDLLKVCGHDHESLKKVIKCVISKSTKIKSAMMGITSNLIEGVVDLTKLMAHGAMHEACLIEVVRTTEEEAFKIVQEVKSCAVEKNAHEELVKYMEENNATVLDIPVRNKTKTVKEDTEEVKPTSDPVNNKTTVTENMNSLLRRIFDESRAKDDKRKNKLVESKNYVEKVDNKIDS